MERPFSGPQTKLKKGENIAEADFNDRMEFDFLKSRKSGKSPNPKRTHTSHCWRCKELRPMCASWMID
jgi:hypothetical protein